LKGKILAIKQTHALSISINKPTSEVVSYLADAFAYPVWATKFFTGPVTESPDGAYVADIKMMGGAVDFALEVNAQAGSVELSFARPGAEPGEPTRVRVIPNDTGTDVLWTLSRVPGSSAIEWGMGLFFMNLELKNLKRVLES
jgi:hypothetical protein